MPNYNVTFTTTFTSEVNANTPEQAIEAIEAIKASMPENEFRGYLKGNALKYLWRYDYKGKPIEDLRKCKWYIDRLIEEVNS